MKLQNLKIKGFKSFADKTDVIFDNQITGIVGPNGCGKSNIVDAIRWVIGEKKISALRSESQAGLVFNGSKTRPASAMAEVSLTFDNDRNVLPTDYSTVTVSRKFYKNGDSEYRLNDVVCRLKDIHNLFLDTGVSNDSYAIIELGMVDDIIKDKDNARRKMIEQAAGVSIYKTRKKEAQSKLKSTEADLNRIEDLLYEIEGNLKSLERQAKKAKKQKELKAEYKDVSILHAQKSLTNFNKDFQQLNRSIIELEETKIKLENDIEQKEQSISSLKEDVNRQEQKLNAMNADFNQMLQVISKLEQDQQLNTQKLHFQKDKLKSVEQLITQNKQQLEDNRKELTELQNQKDKSEESLKNYIAEEETLKKQLDDKKLNYEQTKSEVEKQKSKLLETQNSKFKFEKDLAIIETSISNLRKSIAQENEEQEKRSQKSKEIETQKTEKTQALQKAQEELKNLQAEQEKLKSQVLKQQEQLEQERLKLHDANRQLDAKQNEYDLLRSLVENLEGYPESIKYLSKNNNWHSKPILLSDIILPQEKYKKSIEYILQKYLNYFVTEDFYQAREAIKLLSQNEKGKANFFLLDKIQSQSPLPKLPDLTAAIDVIEYDPKYTQLVQLLLGNVYISEEGDIAEVDLQGNYTLVSLDGDISIDRYSLAGGSTGIFEGNKIGRAKNLDKLAAGIQTLTETAKSLKLSFDNTQNEIQKSQEGLSSAKVEEKKNQIQELQQEVYALTTQLENLKTASAQGQERLKDYNTQLDTHTKNISSIQTENADIESVIQKIHDEISDLDQRYIAAENAYRTASDKWNVYTVELEAKKAQVANATQTINLRTQQIDALKNQLATNQKELEVTSQIIADAETTDTSFIENIEKQVLVKSQRKEELDKLDQAFHIKKKELNEHDQEIAKVRKNRDERNNELIAQKEKMNAMRLQVSTLNERMKLEFDVHLDNILNEEVEIPETEAQLEAKATALKSKIHNLGEVNPTAIEAFEEMAKRNQFMTEQRDDLVEAKENLLKTIEEVEQTANQKFLETFDQVRTNFKQVFNALFTADDTCDLKMTDPDNPAETGIEIYARPKGKKPSVITQLSGGEKTLTSTALLFAIYLIKPAPFCILDEVDAPLDDANVEKFTNMIKQFSEKSQFIIVTHNKQTMAAVDAIYGVTMQEPGVSKLVPVDFRSLN